MGGCSWVVKSTDFFLKIEYFLLFGDAEDVTQGLVHARPLLDHQATSPALEHAS